MTWRKVFRAVFMMPFIVLFVLYDVIKLPLVVFLFIPIGLLMWAIDWTKGEHWSFSEFVWDFSFQGCQVVKMMWSESV